MNRMPRLYGLMAEFARPEELVAAAEQARKNGYRKMEAFTPFPIEHLPEALDLPRTKVPLITLIGGTIGCLGGFFMQYWVAKVNYPQNVGGRPYNSWPSFIPITFELTVLGAALFAILGMLALNGLPRPHHPVFNAPHFEHATTDRFFLCIDASDPSFQREATRSFLESLKPMGITEVEN